MYNTDDVTFRLLLRRCSNCGVEAKVPLLVFAGNIGPGPTSPLIARPVYHEHVVTEPHWWEKGGQGSAANFHSSVRFLKINLQPDNWVKFMTGLNKIMHDDAPHFVHTYNYLITMPVSPLV